MIMHSSVVRFHLICINLFDESTRNVRHCTGTNLVYLAPVVCCCHRLLVSERLSLLVAQQLRHSAAVH